MRLLALLMILVGAVSASAQAVEDFFILTDINAGTAEVRLFPSEGQTLDGAVADVLIAAPDNSTSVMQHIAINPGDGFYSLTVPISPVILWGPGEPNLYAMGLEIYTADGEQIDRLADRFGMREFERRDDRFFINGDPIFIRACGGEQGCACDELTREGMEKRLRAVVRYGFNAIRHHSYVPSEMYLDVADEVGVLIQMEIQGHIGSDPEDEAFASSLANWTSMVERGRGHPSVFVYGMGNEIYRNDPGLIACQNILFDLAKEMDPGVLVLNRSGSNPNNDDHGKYDFIERPIGEYEHTGPLAREAFELYLRGDRMGRSDEYPIIAHEYPLVASYPNPALMPLYDEPPSWLVTTVENLTANGQAHLMDDYVWASERIQAIIRREMLEEARKWPELDGYSMLRFVDCGAYVSGVVNDFAEPKNTTAEEFLRTNGETVLLCTWNERSLEYGDTLEALIEISHHGRDTFASSGAQWWLMNGPTVLQQGTLDAFEVAPVDVATVGEIAMEIPALESPARLTLRTALASPEQGIRNEWHFWAFPGEIPAADTLQGVVMWDPRDRMRVYEELMPTLERITDPAWSPAPDEQRLIITDSWQEAFHPLLERGGDVWVISDKSWPWPEEVGIFGIHITHFLEGEQSPVVFPELDEHCNTWMTICSNAPSRHGISGTLIADHPAMGDFPHEGFCDLQFWPLVYRAKVLQLDRFPHEVQPVIRAIDSFYRGQRKGYMADLAIGEGRVFVSTLNFTQVIERDPAARHLFGQILNHLTSDAWAPAVAMSDEELRTMLRDFASEHAERPPLLHDMRPARYETRWRWLLSDQELVLFNIADAEGADESRFGVHWEYAQTQWYLDAQPGDALTWEFENKTAGDFTLTVPIATPVEGLTLALQVDEGAPQSVVIPVGNWNRFEPVAVTIPALEPGDHTLTISVPADAPTANNRAAQIRDLELRSEATGVR